MYHADIGCNLRYFYSKLDYTFRTYTPPQNPSETLQHPHKNQWQPNWPPIEHLKGTGEKGGAFINI